MRDGAKMDEDMEGKTHTHTQREREYGVVWYNSLSTTTTTTTTTRERERERERDIEHPKESGVGSRSHHPPALGSPSFLAEGLGKDPIPHSVLRIKSDRVY